MKPNTLTLKHIHINFNGFPVIVGAIMSGHLSVCIISRSGCAVSGEAECWVPCSALVVLTCSADQYDGTCHAWRLELQTKVHTKVRNHGEGPYYCWAGWLA